MNDLVDGRYEIRNCIGKGGMGEVYRAYDTHLGVERAIKLVRQASPKERHIPGAEDKRQGYIIRLRREAEATAKLAPHENIVMVYDFIPAHDDTPDYLVMELLEGKLLSEILEKKGKLEPSSALSLMKDICAGVGAAHRRKIVHRDLNARNVMVCDTHRGPLAKVIDFGLAKLPSDSHEMWTVITKMGEFMGTPAYAPPEQWLDSSDVDARAEVYSLGILLYELLSGYTPFQAGTTFLYRNKHMSASPASFSKDLNVPTEIEKVVRRALKKKPKQRQRDADELYQTLHDALARTQQDRIAEIEVLRDKTQSDLKRRVEKERKIIEQVESLRIADAEARHRIEEAEVKRRTAEDAYRLVAEKVQRVEAEANFSEAEEKRMLARLEDGRRLLEEAKRRADDEQIKLEEEARRQAEAEQHRLAELEVARKKAEFESKHRADQEQQILSQINSLRIADAEVRKRIEEAEVRRHKQEDAYRLVAEKVQRVEAEAKAIAAEEEQMLARLETERRNLTNEAQARIEQEKRIKEEIEMFGKLEDEERPRIEELTLQRAAAEARLQQQRDHLLAEEEAQLRAEEQLKMVAHFRRTVPDETEETVAGSEPEELIEEASPMSPANGADRAAVPASVAARSEVPAPISLYLGSVDPYKRAAAVAELARSKPTGAFALISERFDDHSPHVRNAAARALRKLKPTLSFDLFKQAMEEGSDERRRNIGGAIAASGLATEAIDSLASENREDTQNALSLLFVMANTGEVDTLVKTIEEHKNDEVSRAITKLLTLSGHSEIADAALKRRMVR